MENKLLMRPNKKVRNFAKENISGYTNLLQGGAKLAKSILSSNLYLSACVQRGPCGLGELGGNSKKVLHLMRRFHGACAWPIISHPPINMPLAISHRFHSLPTQSTRLLNLEVSTYKMTTR